MGPEVYKSLQKAARGANFRGLYIENPSDARPRQPVSPFLEENFPNRISLGVYLLPSGTICKAFFTDQGNFVTTPIDPNYAAERGLPAKAIERFQKYIESSTPSRVRA